MGLGLGKADPSGSGHRQGPVSEASPGLLQAGPLCDLLPRSGGPRTWIAGTGWGGQQAPATVQVRAEGAGGQVDTAEGRAGPESG